MGDQVAVSGGECLVNCIELLASVSLNAVIAGATDVKGAFQTTAEHKKTENNGSSTSGNRCIYSKEISFKHKTNKHIGSIQIT